MRTKMRSRLAEWYTAIYNVYYMTRFYWMVDREWTYISVLQLIKYRPFWKYFIPRCECLYIYFGCRWPVYLTLYKWRFFSFREYFWCMPVARPNNHTSIHLVLPPTHSSSFIVIINSALRLCIFYFREVPTNIYKALLTLLFQTSVDIIITICVRV